MTLTAPFPYPGGKRRVAELVWPRFGNPVNYVENFFGSGAMLLARPDVDLADPPRETVNDKCCFIANFWRAVQADPERVAALCDWPVNEADLTSRHKWLVRHAREIQLATRCMDDPEFFDAKVAGWWCWGLSQWIGGGWCTAYEGDEAVASEPRAPSPEPGDGPDGHRSGSSIVACSEQIPRLGASQGIHSMEGRPGSTLGWG